MSAHRGPSAWEQRQLRGRSGRHRRQRLAFRVGLAMVTVLVVRTQLGG